MSDRLFKTSAAQVDAALLVLRVVLGVIFIMHGGQKLFVFGIGGIQDAFGQFGIPAASVTGPAVGFVELLGGLAVLAGAATRVAALGLSTVMAGAVLMVHLPAGFFAPQGFEFPLALLGSALALTIAGGGAWSVDAVLAQRTAPRRTAERLPAHQV